MILIEGLKGCRRTNAIHNNKVAPDLGLQIRPGTGLEPNVLELEA